jgi:DNA-binding GntR family transcriptional regulator
MVYAALREAILTRQLPGGTPLIEANLAQQFGVSKTPIREALQRLAHGGLVDMELARGATVHTLTLDEIRDIFEMRLLLEPLALRQSAPLMTADDLVALETVLTEAAGALEAGDYPNLSALNGRFHGLLYSRAANHLLVRWLDSLSDRRRLITMHGWAMENRSGREWEEHRGIFEALTAGDTEAAAARLAAHITRFSEIIFTRVRSANVQES